MPQGAEGILGPCGQSSHTVFLETFGNPLWSPQDNKFYELVFQVGGS